MRIILLITASFIASFCYGQNFFDVVISSLTKEQLFSKVVSNSELSKYKLFNSFVDIDSIDFDVVVYSDFINEKGNHPDVLQGGSYYQVLVYTIHDSIFLKSVKNLKYEKEKGKNTEINENYLFIDTTKALHFIEQHNQKYFSSWTLNDFLHPDSIYKNAGGLSFFCGYVAHETENAYTLAKLVKLRDTVTLRILATSFSAEQRAFGCVGLCFLLFRGQMLSNGLLELIDAIQENKSRTFLCEGCIMRWSTYKEELQMWKLKIIYDRLVRDKVL